QPAALSGRYLRPRTRADRARSAAAQRRRHAIVQLSARMRHHPPVALDRKDSSARPKAPKRSPAMEQFFRAKQAYPDTILFFRMGDFYEMFFEDAGLASDLLDLTLTKRGNDEHGIAIPMAGVPHHAASGYIARLIERGQRVAICEQMEDPSKVKGVVPREVVRVVTPGLLLDPDALDARAHNYLASVSGDGERIGLAVIEFSTAEARACVLTSSAEVLAELVRLDAHEILLEPALAELQKPLASALPHSVFRITEPSFASDTLAPALQALLDSA